MILPAAHYGRDGLVAVALIAELMSVGGRSLRELADELPRTAMIKSKLGRPDEAWARTAERLKAAFTGMALDQADGLRFSGEREWVHVRASGTEPVVRVIAESEDEERTRSLVARARRALEHAKARGTS